MSSSGSGGATTESTQIRAIPLVDWGNQLLPVHFALDPSNQWRWGKDESDPKKVRAWFWKPRASLGPRMPSCEPNFKVGVTRRLFSELKSSRIDLNFVVIAVNVTSALIIKRLIESGFG